MRATHCPLSSYCPTCGPTEGMSSVDSLPLRCVSAGGQMLSDGVKERAGELVNEVPDEYAS